MANETVLFKRGDSATITSTPVTDGQILFDTSGNGKMYLDNGTDRLEMGGAITVDASLSKTSTNAIQNKAVTGNILNSLAEVSAATQQNTIAGALALKEVNSSLTDLGGFKPVIDETTGEITGYKTTIGGADTVFPFKRGKLIFATKFAYSTKDNGGTCYSFSVDGIDKILITGIALRSGTGLYVVPNNNITTDASTTPSISDSISTVISTTPLEVDVSSYDYITLMYYGGDQYITFKVESL